MAPRAPLALVDRAPLVAGPDHVERARRRARYVYACDCRHDPTTGVWYLYFNGRDHAAMAAGREAIGFVVAGKAPSPGALGPRAE